MPAEARQSRVCEKEGPLALDHRTIVIVQRGLMFLVSSRSIRAFFDMCQYISSHAAYIQVVFLQGSSVATAELWPKKIFLLSLFSSIMTLNFGVSQCANGLTVKQNLVLVLCALMLLTEQLVKLISGQMGFRIPVAVVLVLQVVLNLGFPEVFPGLDANLG